MMSKTFLLRENPELKLILNNKDFQIINSYNKNHNGTYRFCDLKKVKLIDRKEGVNWSTVIISLIIDLLSNSSLTSGSYKDSKQLKIYLKQKTIAILLFDAHWNVVQQVTDSLKFKLN